MFGCVKYCDRYFSFLMLLVHLRLLWLCEGSSLTLVQQLCALNGYIKDIWHMNRLVQYNRLTPD